MVEAGAGGRKENNIPVLGQAVGGAYRLLHAGGPHNGQRRTGADRRFDSVRRCPQQDSGLYLPAATGPSGV